MIYCQCPKCYLLTIKDGYRNCPKCNTRINNPRGWDYSQRDVDLNKAKEIKKEYGKFKV